MKQIILTFILILISGINTDGQDYQTINSGRIAYFDDQYRNIKCIRIDSVKIRTDSIFYPFYEIQQLNDLCFSPKVASWIGKSVTIKEDGLNAFVNKAGDTITINTHASIGDKWIAFQIADSLIIEAAILKHDTLTFLGINDSVKTIGFQCYSKNRNPIDMGLNDMQLQLSRNYGFVQMVNFYQFPGFQADYSSEKLENYNLIGLSNPEAGVQNLKWFEVNDFQEGDELHILNASSCWYGNGSGSATTMKSIFKYLERKDYSDSIVYCFSRKQSIYQTWSDSSSFIYSYDTLKTTIKQDTLFDRLPGEPIISDHEIFSYYMKNGSPLSKNYPIAHEILYLATDSCWRMLIADGCLSEEKFIKGLGGPYYSCTQFMCLGGAERSLVYFKKGDVTWGNPLTITGNPEISTVKDIRVYPNPVQDKIYITFANNNYQDSYVNIYDLQGKMIKHIRLEKTHSEINLSGIKNGLYIVKIVDDGNIVRIEKIVKE